MSVASHLERRGAVYYWRRRLPLALARKFGQRFLVISLRTREPICARYMGAQLDAILERMTLTGSDHWVSRDQLQAFFRRSFRIHQEVIRRTHFGYRDAHREPYDEHGSIGVAEGWAYRLIEKQGLAAVVRPEDRLALQEAGLDESTIGSVSELLKWYTSPKQAEHMRFSVARVLTEIGAVPTDDNIARVLSIYARAKSEAALQTKPESEDELDFAALIDDAKSDGSSIAWTKTVSAPARAPAPVILQPSSAPIITPAVPGSPWPSEPVTPPKPERPPKLPGVGLSIAALGEKLISDRTQDKAWDDKMVRQARMIIDLFGRFVAETYKISDLADLRTPHLDDFDGFLRDMSKSYGKAAADRTRSIADLKARWAALPAVSRGLEVKTRNKHYFFLNHLLARARKAGVAVARDLSFSGYRAKPKGRARNDRAIPDVNVFEKIFDQPIYTGCAGWDQPFVAGSHVFHRAAYFGPMFAHYHGLRREEFCGLELSDIILDKGPPHIWVQPNELRTLKNDQSERQLALHPELLRLGLVDYLGALRAIGETRLFPELVSPSSNSPLGDRYYDEWKPGLTKLGFTPHVQRHYFNNALKQQFVHSEVRADLMGHGGKGETEERYADAMELEGQLKAIAKIPVVTAHLDRCPIKLIPWVERREIAPWSRAGVAARRESEAAARKAKVPRSRRP